MAGIFQTRPVSGAMGVEISGVDLTRPLSDTQAIELRQLMDAHQLLLFRGQNLDDVSNVRTVGIFGKVSDENEDGSGCSIVSNVRDDSVVRDEPLAFHADFAWTPYPRPYFSLYGLDVEGPTVPTLFANGIRACRNLPANIRSRLEGRTLIQTYDYTETGGYDKRAQLLTLDPMPPESTHPRAEHPVLMTHPRTGEPLVFAMQAMTSHIVGMTSDESERMLADLFAILYAPNNVYRHQWKTGDLVIWDSLAVQHGRHDPDDSIKRNRRTLRRVVIGDKVPRDHMKGITPYPHLASRFKKIRAAHDEGANPREPA